MSIEVAITPSKTGRLGIKEGDDLSKVAASFCKAYQLDSVMQQQLTDQLEAHRLNYYRQQQLIVQKENESKIIKQIKDNEKNFDINKY